MFKFFKEKFDRLDKIRDPLYAVEHPDDVSSMRYYLTVMSIDVLVDIFILIFVILISYFRLCFLNSL